MNNKRLFTSAEMSTIILAAYDMAKTSDDEVFEDKLEKIVLNKIYEFSEQARLAALVTRH